MFTACQDITKKDYETSAEVPIARRAEEEEAFMKYLHCKSILGQQETSEMGQEPVITV